MYFADEFVMIHASYLSHISEDVILAPQSKLNDGVIWLLIIRNGIKRATFLQVRNMKWSLDLYRNKCH